MRYTNRFQDPWFWENERRACLQYAVLCRKFPDQYAPEARDPDVWIKQAGKARRVRDRLMKTPNLIIMEDTQHKTQTVDEIAAEVKKAVEGSKQLEIVGYRSSTGNVSALRVTLVGHDGYLDMIREALDQLGKGELKPPPDESQEDICKAAAQLAASWTKTIHGAHNRPKSGWDPEKDGNLDLGMGARKDGAQQAVYVYNMRVHNRVVVGPGSKNPPSKNGAVRVKNDLTLQTPLATYLGQLKLAPGKQISVQAL